MSSRLGSQHSSSSRQQCGRRFFPNPLAHATMSKHTLHEIERLSFLTLHVRTNCEGDVLRAVPYIPGGIIWPMSRSLSSRRILREAKANEPCCCSEVFHTCLWNNPRIVGVCEVDSWLRCEVITIDGSKVSIEKYAMVPKVCGYQY